MRSGEVEHCFETEKYTTFFFNILNIQEKTTGQICAKIIELAELHRHVSLHSPIDIVYEYRRNSDLFDIHRFIERNNASY